jgi:hypothetical protein
MAKSDLLKEAIADAKAVKETALANAKIALEEAFAPRIQSMLSTKLAEEDMEDDHMATPMGEAEMDLEAELGDAGMDAEMDAGADMDAEMGADVPDAVGVGVDLDNDGSYDIEGDLGAGDDMDAEAELDGMGDEMEPEGDMADDLELESIIRELEEDLEEEMNDDDLNSVNEEMDDKKDDETNEGRGKTDDDTNEGRGNKKIEEDLNIDEIIESILSEEDEEDKKDDETNEGRGKPMNAADENPADDKPADTDLQEELTEAYDTIQSLRGTINEVNLLNAKLLYTNKLFRNFELDENQKMKVIENFDRAGNTREVKLVFSTLAESFHVPLKKRVMVKESYASKPVETTAPTTKTKQIINEGNELANRWKKLAGLLD